MSIEKSHHQGVLAAHRTNVPTGPSKDERHQDAEKNDPTRLIDIDLFMLIPVSV